MFRLDFSCLIHYREREETITDKEKRIFDLKKKNQELEKFRFVLDYKIKELKLQIAPREHEIATMKKQIEEMNIELEQYQKSNQSLNLMIDELKLKIDGIRGEYSLQEDRCTICNRFLEKFCADLQELWLCKHDIHLFKQKMIRMYRIYVQEEINNQLTDKKGENSSFCSCLISNFVIICP
jgi:chromosome segregation ATPase